MGWSSSKDRILKGVCLNVLDNVEGMRWLLLWGLRTLLTHVVFR